MSEYIPESENEQADTVILVFLTKGYVAIVDPIDADLALLKWQVLVQDHSPTYARTHAPTKGRETILLHRIILGRILGRSMLPTERCDHINGNGLDNRRQNLRLATAVQNARNSKRPSNNSSGYKGVHWHKQHQCWIARISVNGKSIHLGMFDDPRRAYETYCEAAKKYHGDFARFD